MVLAVPDGEAQLQRQSQAFAPGAIEQLDREPLEHPIRAEQLGHQHFAVARMADRDGRAGPLEHGSERVALGQVDAERVDALLDCLSAGAAEELHAGLGMTGGGHQLEDLAGLEGGIADDFRGG